MSAFEVGQPFDTIESAYDFMGVLGETVLDAIKDLHRDHQNALQDGNARTAQAIEIALFKAKTLNSYVHRSRRALNDLRTLRRLILNERLTPEAVMAAVQHM